MRLFIIVVFGIFCLVSCNDNDLPENNKKVYIRLKLIRFLLHPIQ